jgi:beta-lactamase class A
MVAGAVGLACVGAGGMSADALASAGAALDGADASAGVADAGAGASAAGDRTDAKQSRPAAAASQALATLERRMGGQLGVLAIDTATGRRLEHRASERFAMCSTFKFIAAAAILARVDRGAEHLDRKLTFSQSDLFEYAPFSKEHVAAGSMTLAEACEAAVELSDNTAANLMLKALGGPSAVTEFIRSVGDGITRLDNVETALNIVGPGEVHDTATPASMVRLLSTLLMGQVLSLDSRSRLQTWMLNAKVGEHRVLAGLPTGWRIAHKTGTWDDQTNDVGVIWPTNRAPVVFAVFYKRGDMPLEKREGVLRDVGRIFATAF